MGTLQIQLSSSDIQQLIDKYRMQDGSGLINYSGFVHNINEVFGETANKTQSIHGAKSQPVSLPLQLLDFQ